MDLEELHLELDLAIGRLHQKPQLIRAFFAAAGLTLKKNLLLWATISRPLLRPTGRLIASLPNVRHHSVVRSLLAGNWPYEPSGLLDATRLGFFTRRSLARLLARAGFSLEACAVVPGPGYREWEMQGRRNKLCLDGLTIQGRRRGAIHTILFSSSSDPSGSGTFARGTRGPVSSELS